MTNLFVHPRYAEHVVHLAVGVEPLDAVAGVRLGAPGLRVLVEDQPAPLDRWRSWRPGETLDTVLGGLDHHPSGRFARVVDRPVADPALVGRVIEPYRRIVPRRLGLTMGAPTDPPWQRMFPVGLFPGSAAGLPRGATVVRGRVVRLADDGVTPVPVRWARVRATDDAQVPAELGWAHGDDRGEFVLVVGHPPGAIVVPPDEREVSLTVGATLPPAEPDPLDPLRPAVDPLWDLPVEPLVATPDPGADPAHGGRTFLAGQSSFGPFPFPVLLGRETSIEIQIA